MKSRSARFLLADYQPLSGVDGSPTVALPLSSHLFAVRAGGDRAARRHARWLARRAPPQPLSSPRWTRVRSRPRPDREEAVVHLLAASPLDPLYYAIGWLLAFFYTFIPQPRHRDDPAHAGRDAGAVPADREADPLDDPDAAGAAGDQEDPAEVQGRPDEAERGAAEVLPREQDQPAGRLPAAAGHLPDRYRGVPHLLAGCAAPHSAVGPLRQPVQRDLHQGDDRQRLRQGRRAHTAGTDQVEPVGVHVRSRITTPRARRRPRSGSSV